MKSERLQRALDELERAFEEFRVVYAAWLSDGGDSRALSDALLRAQEKLDQAREELASADEATT